MDKAYKLLAHQEGISNKKAKEYIDKGYVFVGHRKVNIARAELKEGTKFRLLLPKELALIYEDDNLCAVDKPHGEECYTIERRLPGLSLIHRLDRSTSGVLLLAKNEEFRECCIQEFKAKRVQKGYLAWVEGVVPEAVCIEEPIGSKKIGNRLKSFIDSSGKEAKTTITPLEVRGRSTLLEVAIETGRTHQIRVHLAHIGHPIAGDVEYGGKQRERIYLHAGSIALLDYAIESPAGERFRNPGEF